jgi:hypothetical protein
LMLRHHRLSRFRASYWFCISLGLAALLLEPRAGFGPETRGTRRCWDALASSARPRGGSRPGADVRDSLLDGA